MAPRPARARALSPRSAGILFCAATNVDNAPRLFPCPVRERCGH
jgi:hypothetical protein